ncbi:MAG: putative tellurite resistance protein B-like protein [Alteromonadaceae bacterium]|jgi:uncharacterized tellurite resistance protein B-like protein
MIAKINAFFKKISEATNVEQHDEITIEIACAVLLCEVVRADGHLDKQEEIKLSALLVRQFDLEKDEVESIVHKALFLSEHATDFYQFTSKLNQYYSIEERIKIVELLWVLAYADGELANIEEHIIRKIADLLHLRHSEYIQTKRIKTV